MIRYRLKKKYAILAVVFAGLGLFLLVLGGSYAFFTNQVTSKDYVIYTGNLQIDYTRTGNLINLTKAYPKTNTEGLQEEGYSFNITNNGNIDARYQIRLELDNSNTLPLEYIKMAYIRTKSNSTQTDEEIEPILLSNLNNTLTFISDKQIGAGKEDSYNLKLWIDYNAPNDIQGKTFKATIVVDSLQDVEDGYAIANTRPIITLNKYSDGNTDSHILVNEQFTDPGILSVKDDKYLLTEEDVNITYKYTNDGENLTTVSNIDTTTPGVYYIDYEVTDNDNLTTSITRVVTVNETASIPTITLNGDASVTLQEGDTYTEQGATSASNIATIGEVKTSVVGTYVVRYIAIDENNNMNSVTRTVTVNRRTVWDFEYTGDVQTFTVPYAGTYKLETWGAQGGHNNSNSNVNYGGYSTGTILLEKDKILKVVVGESPTSNIGGYNGGGTGLNNGTQSGYGGGGATHIAKNDENNYSVLSSYTNETNARNYVYIVAGAGGGTGINTNGNHLVSGGAGGGLNGIDGSYASQYPTYVGHGGTQTTAGALCAECTNTGSFGTGGNYCLSNFAAPGGGAGWYGGSGTSRYHAGAGGGSSFIGGVTDGQTIAGNQTVTEPDGTTATGHSGNGYARITYLGN